jgi:hypothetical protein
MLRRRLADNSDSIDDDDIVNQNSSREELFGL